MRWKISCSARRGRSKRLVVTKYASVPMTGFMSAVACGAVEVEDAVHVAVVGDPDRRLTVGDGPVAITSGTRAAPSSIEYSVCRCRCTNDELTSPTYSPVLHWPVFHGLR